MVRVATTVRDSRSMLVTTVSIAEGTASLEGVGARVTVNRTVRDSDSTAVTIVVTGVAVLVSGRVVDSESVLGAGELPKPSVRCVLDLLRVSSDIKQALKANVSKDSRRILGQLRYWCCRSYLRGRSRTLIESRYAWDRGSNESITEYTCRRWWICHLRKCCTRL